MLTLAPGVEIVPGYKLVKPLGQGGFGEVWQAEAPGGFAVALKFIRLDTTHAEPELRALEVIRDIRHPHLLDIQFAVHIEDRLVIAMPLCDRSAWDRYQECRGAGQVGIGPEELLRYMGESALALDFLNEPQGGPGGRKGVAHRDVKPHNIFLVGGSVRLADFGLAKILERSVASHTGSMTPAYAPPEMFARKVSAQSDQWSLAVTYMQMRTGVLPFVGSVHEMVFSIMKDEPDLAFLPEDERAVVARALEKDPKDRWPSCGALVEALRVAAGVPVGARAGVRSAPSLPEGAPRAPARRDEKSTGTAQAEDTNKQPVKALAGAGAGAARYATFGQEVETAEPAHGQPRWAAENKPKRRGVGAVAAAGAAVLGLALLAAGAAVVYVQTDKGTLVVESDDPNVQVLVKRDGADVTLVDCKTKAQVAIRSGTYQLELVGGTKPLALSTDRFTLMRGGVETVRVRFEEEAGGAARDEGVAAAGQTPTPLNPPLAKGGDKRELAKSGDQEVATAPVAEKPAVAVAENKAEPVPDKEAAIVPVPVQPPPPSPPQPKPARFVVKVEPPEAIVKVKGTGATLGGAGEERALVVEKPDASEEIEVEASLEGYETVTKTLSPVSGETGRVLIELVALPVELEVKVEPGAAEVTVAGIGARVGRDRKSGALGRLGMQFRRVGFE